MSFGCKALHTHPIKVPFAEVAHHFCIIILAWSVSNTLWFAQPCSEVKCEDDRIPWELGDGCNQSGFVTYNGMYEKQLVGS